MSENKITEPDKRDKIKLTRNQDELPSGNQNDPYYKIARGYISCSDQRELESSYGKCDSKHNKKHWTEKIEVMFIGLSFFATAAATAFSGWQAFISREAFIDSERAWVIPKGIVNPQTMDPPHPVQRGQPIYLQLNYENVGREPAVDFQQYWGADIYPVSNPFAALDDLKFPDPGCDDTYPKSKGPVIYPSIPMSFIAPVNKEKDVATAVLDGTGVFYVNFCFAYRTITAIHRSGFCFYLHIGANTRQPQWSQCNGGSSAD